MRYVIANGGSPELPTDAGTTPDAQLVGLSDRDARTFLRAVVDVAVAELVRTRDRYAAGELAYSLDRTAALLLTDGLSAQAQRYLWLADRIREIRDVGSMVARVLEGEEPATAAGGAR